MNFLNGVPWYGEVLLGNASGNGQLVSYNAEKDEMVDFEWVSSTRRKDEIMAFGWITAPRVTPFAESLFMINN